MLPNLLFVCLRLGPQAGCIDMGDLELVPLITSLSNAGIAPSHWVMQWRGRSPVLHAHYWMSYIPSLPTINWNFNSFFLFFLKIYLFYVYEYPLTGCEPSCSCWELTLGPLLPLVNPTHSGLPRSLWSTLLPQSLLALAHRFIYYYK